VGEDNDRRGHAFVSYVREDALEVDQLQRVLESAGVRVWRDTADLWPGEDWRERIRQAITQDALAFIACFSRNSVAREVSYQNEELLLAIEQMRLRRPGMPWLIPVRFSDCDIPDSSIGGNLTLRSIQRVDMFGDRFAEGAERLVAGVLRILGRHASKIDALIAAGESDNIEFKSSLHHLYRPLPSGQLAKLERGKVRPQQAQREARKWIQIAVTKTIAAFLNTSGGTLLIGVDDSGTVLGIEPDFEYCRPGKQNADGWLLSLKDVIINALGPDIWSAINVSLAPHKQKTVAVVRCPRRTSQTWHKGDGGERFYIRALNTTQELTGRSLVRYIHEHWPE
jgi:TIR domain/Putative DNA-binding domain